MDSSYELEVWQAMRSSASPSDSFIKANIFDKPLPSIDPDSKICNWTRVMKNIHVNVPRTHTWQMLKSHPKPAIFVITPRTVLIHLIVPCANLYWIIVSVEKVVLAQQNRLEVVNLHTKKRKRLLRDFTGNKLFQSMFLARRLNCKSHPFVE